MNAADNNTHLSELELHAFEADAKVAVLATVSPEGLPHITLLTSLQGKDADTLMFGQFTEGASKENLRQHPESAFIVMTADSLLWQGKARWRGQAKSGADYDAYNHKPLFRYNAYSGIHTVHYLDLLEIAGPRKPSKIRIAAGHFATALRAQRAATRESFPILNTWTRSLLSKAGTLKFLAWIGEDGYPLLHPLVPCVAAGGKGLVFAGGRLDEGLPPEDTPIAVLALNLNMESVLLRGRFLGCRRRLGVPTGGIEVDWIYNSMPPKQGQIYPIEPIRGVSFEQSGASHRAA